MQRHQREANLPNFLSVQDIKTLYRIALFRAVYPTDVFREKWHLYVLLEEEFVYGKQVTAVFSNTHFYLFVPLDIFQEIQHNKKIRMENLLTLKGRVISGLKNITAVCGQRRKRSCISVRS